MSIKSRQEDPIAIIGYASHLPGSSTNHGAWDTILRGLDHLSDLPDDRLDVTAYYDPTPSTKDKIYCKRGAFMPPFDFDPATFKMNPYQIEDSDTNQTLTLLQVKRALQHAGKQPMDGSRKNIGCVLGIGGGQKLSNELYSRLNYVVLEKVLAKMGMSKPDRDNAIAKYKAHFPEWRLDSFPGMLGNVTAGRCANVFNLDGMNGVVDAACASSLFALKVAVDELYAGNCREMITGATCTDNSVGMYMAFSKTPVFSTADSLTAYQDGSSGMLIGEGSVMFVLKKLSHAVEDGDTVHAVLRACSSSSDGKSQGIYIPVSSGQSMCLKRAYESAGVDPSSVTLVEGHGTGTNKGDQIELGALQSVFSGAKPDQVAVGSFKSQIGHLKAVAGFAGLLRVVLALQHNILPGTIHVENPPRALPWKDSPIYINRVSRPWFCDPEKYPRRAGVSSFGFGGANFHCVVEEYRQEPTQPYRMNNLPVPVVLGAASRAELWSWLQRVAIPAVQTDYAAWLECHGPRSLRGAPNLAYRLGFLAADQADCLRVLRGLVDGGERDPLPPGVVVGTKSYTAQQVAVLFPGQGSFAVNMCSDVAMNWPEFREHVYAADRAMVSARGYRISECLFPRAPYAADETVESGRQKERLADTKNSQPAIVACSAGLFDILRGAGLRPAFVGGHSLGEITALYAAGGYTRESLYTMLERRAVLAAAGDHTSQPGGMAAIIGDAGRLAQYRPSAPGVSVANRNAPSQIVIGGPCDALEKECKSVEGSFRVVRLSVSRPFHTSHMESANREFLASHPCPPGLSSSLYSCTSGAPYKSPESFDHLQDHGVDFVAMVRRMYDDGARLFVECGPVPVLRRMVAEILSDKEDVHVVSTGDRRMDSEMALRMSVLQLMLCGLDMSDFDGWDLAAPVYETKASKRTVKITGASFVSKRRKEALDRVMSDGYRLTSSSAVSDDAVEALRVRMELDREQHALDRESWSRELSRSQEELKKQVEEVKRLTTASRGSSNGCSGARVSGSQDTSVSVLRHDSSGAGSKGATRVVLAVMAEKTGYDVDDIEPGMDMEEELGIDSIKRVEILGSVQTQLGVTVDDTDALSQTRTVQDVIDFMAQLGGAGGNGGKDDDARPSVSVAASYGNLTITRPVLDSQRAGEPTYALAWEKMCSGAIVVAYGLDDTVCGHLRVAFGSSVDIVVHQDGKTLDVSGPILGAVVGVGVSACEAIAFAGRVGPKLSEQPIGGVRPFFVGLGSLGGKLGLFDSPRDFRALCHDSVLLSAGISGVVKSLSLEWPHVNCRFVDVESTTVDMLRRVVLECVAVAPEVEVGLTDDGARHCLRLVHVDCESTIVPAASKPLGAHVILVVGGARGVTPHCVRPMVRPGSLVVFTGRSVICDVPAWYDADGTDRDVEKSIQRYEGSGAGLVKMGIRELRRRRTALRASSEIRDTLDMVRSAATGVRVQYVACDVLDPVAVAKVVQSLETIDVVLYAAGVIRDKRVEFKTMEDSALVFRTKVVGLQHVVDALLSPSGRRVGRGAMPKVVLFSSMAAVKGNIGQTDYAAANEVFNYLSRLGGPNVVSLCFGPWESGMVTPRLKQHFESMGVEIIPLREGGALVSDIVSTDSLGGQVVIGNWIQPANSTDHLDVETLSGMELRGLCLVVGSAYIASGHVIQGNPVVPLATLSDYVASTLSTMYRGSKWADVHLDRAAVYQRVLVGERLQLSIKRETSTTHVKVCNRKGAPVYKFVFGIGSPFSGSPRSDVADAMPSRPGPSQWVPWSYDVRSDCLFHRGAFRHLCARSGNWFSCQFDWNFPRSLDLMLDALVQTCVVLEHDRSGRRSLPTGIDSLWYEQGIELSLPTTYHVLSDIQETQSNDHTRVFRVSAYASDDASRGNIMSVRITVVSSPGLRWS